MKPPIPLLFLSDAPDARTGLGRITRDLASLVSSHCPEFRVGCLGIGGVGSRQLPFPCYQVQQLAGEWGQGVIEQVWSDFAGAERGIVLTIEDLTRMTWFLQPAYLNESAPQLASFLQSDHFERWGYIPIDSTGPANRLSGMSANALLGYDRLLAYTEFGEQIIRNSIGDQAAEARSVNWLPHGLNIDVFTPRTQAEGMAALNQMSGRPILHPGDFLVGAVGTNQARKDWGLMFATAGVLRQQIGKRFKFWVHTDLMERYWSIPALAADFGLSDCLITTPMMEDTALSYCYSACDVTIHPGLGEGFGYPVFESLACGTPAIAGNYAGTASIDVADAIEFFNPYIFRLDTLHNCLRPVYRPEDVVDAVMRARNINNVMTEADRQQFYRDKVKHLGWHPLFKSVWQRWFREGAEAFYG